MNRVCFLTELEAARHASHLMVSALNQAPPLPPEHPCANYANPESCLRLHLGPVEYTALAPVRGQVENPISLLHRLSCSVPQAQMGGEVEPMEWVKRELCQTKKTITGARQAEPKHGPCQVCCSRLPAAREAESI